MSILVTDSGFHPDDWTGGFLRPDDLDRRPCAVGLGLDLDPERDRAGDIARYFPALGLIRIRLAHFAQAEGFALAEALRRAGYGGRLRAQGHVLADQYTLARRAGFDEVEISAGLALRQPEEHWRFRGNWRHAAYGSRMGPRADPCGGGPRGTDSGPPAR
jgi:uncharacterized protein (DUF934 family)